MKTAKPFRKNVKLRPTAALVMLWAKDFYTQAPAKVYYDQLDLSEGLSLYDRCQSICPWYREVILNRKFAVRSFFSSALGRLSSPADVLILGAGMDPLGLELHHAFPRTLSKIYEIDQSGMRQKKKLYEKTGAGWKKKIRLVESGISAQALRKILPESIRMSETPLFVIAEGLTYYLAEKSLKDLFLLFPAGRKNVTWFLEYLVPHKIIRPERRFIPRRIFHFIRSFAGLPSISRYTREDLARMLRPAGFSVSRRKTLCDMERERTRTARYFKKASDGWIECLVARRVSEDGVKRRESFRL